MKRKRVKAKLRLHPDPILTQVCEPVEDGEDVSGIIRDMMHILTNSNHGVGLAAPQAGHLKRVILVKEQSGYSTYINPEIHNPSVAMTLRRESCLSYPGERRGIKRHNFFNLTSMTSFGIFNSHHEDMNARIIQHEIDHLNGKCRVGELK